MTLPIPLHVGHVPRSCAPRSLPIRLRVNSSNPRFENDWIVARVRSRRRPSSSVLIDLVARRLRRHVDEVDDDDAADVAQAHLARDLLGRLDVRLDNRVFEVAPAGELSGVHVDDGQRLGRLDHDRSARRQVDLRLHQLLQLFVDLVVVEERAPGVVILDAVDVLRPEQLQEVANLAVLFLVVDQDALDVGRDEVARRLVDEVHVLVKQRRRWRAFVHLQDAVPHADQHAEVGDQLGLADARRPRCGRRSPCPRAECAS